MRDITVPMGTARMRRDLLVAEVLDVAQDHRGPEDLGQGLEGPLEVLAAAGQRVLRGGHGRAVAAELHRAGRPGGAAEGVGADAVEDRVQPGPDVGARGEAVEGAVGAQEGLLDQVLGVVRVPGHAVGGPVEGPQVRDGLGLESFIAVHDRSRASLQGETTPRLPPIPRARPPGRRWRCCRQPLGRCRPPDLTTGAVPPGPPMPGGPYATMIGPEAGGISP